MQDMRLLYLAYPLEEIFQTLSGKFGLEMKGQIAACSVT